MRSVYASGVLRVLNRVKPRRDQPYQTMQLMQFNYFLEHGLLRYDPATGRLHVDYDRYHDVVAGMLAEVLALQRGGNRPAVDAFIERWATWRPDLHEVLGRRMREVEGFRYNLVRFAALGE